MNTPMATFVQLEEGNGGLLPPLKEIFLEIQVNKLIQEYLFSSNADDMRESLHDGSSENKEMKVPVNRCYAKDTALRIACDCTPCVKSTEALHYHNHKQSCPHDPHHMQTTCIKEEEECLRTINTSTCDTSFAALSVENEGKLMYKTAYLNRVDTFPCTSKQAGTPQKANTDLKVSCKKPPRPPPRVAKSDQLGPSLTRSCSDNGAYLQSSRRAKLERKRKATPTFGVDTSIWALLFTLCFAIIMIAQGFWSQDSQNFATYGTSDASSPVDTFMIASSKVLPAEVSSAGAAERKVSMEGVYVFEATRRALP